MFLPAHVHFECVDCKLLLCETCLCGRIFFQFFNANICLDCKDKRLAKALPPILAELEEPFKRINSKTCWIYSKLLNDPYSITLKELDYIVQYKLLTIGDILETK